MLRRFLAALTAIALLGWQALPSTAMLTVTEMHGFNAGGASTPSVTFVGCTASTTDATTYTYTDHATGTAAANRVNIIGVMAEDSADNFEVSTMTVGGSSATERFDQSNVSYPLEQALYVFANASGTTATIEVTFSEAITGSAICVWAAYSLASTTPVDTGSDNTPSGGLLSFSYSTPANSITVGIGTDASNSAFAWDAPMTERADAGAGTEFRYTAADLTSTAADTLVDLNPGGAGDAMGMTATFQ
jgi:hypothetical protein